MSIIILSANTGRGHISVMRSLKDEFCEKGKKCICYEDFYESLDKLDKCLETNRFLFGDYITDSDVRAYVTLARSLP